MDDILDDGRINRILEEAIIEDIGTGDITTDAIVAPNAVGAGTVLLKEDGIVSGLEIAAAVFAIIDPTIKFHILVEDGAKLTAGTQLASLHGPLSSILKGERTALNILQRMSGISSLTQRFVRRVEGTSAKITDTRKTAPGLRVLDKLAVKMGGGVNHRFGLDDMVLIKDNHIEAAGSVSKALERCIAYLKQHNIQLKIEIETKNLPEVQEALHFTFVDRIMLDNFPVEEMKKAVAMNNGKVKIEASGNVSLETVRPIAETGVDFISIGALTHSPKALDISLKISSPATRKI
ncbi:MAG: carboxylating nicotinate-nucleotide diphosphorylase [Bacteroidota bacterium]